MQSSPVIEQVKRLRAAQAAREAKELERLVAAYAGIDRAARRDAEALALKLAAEFEKTGRLPTASQIRKISRYRELMDTVTNELEQYQSFMRVELRAQSALAVTEGEKAARTLAQLAARDVGLSAEFRALNPAVIEQLVGFLDPNGPLYKRLGLLSGWTADKVSETIIEGIARGLGPRATAAMLTKTITDGVTNSLGMGLSSALRTMRTTQLYAYRYAGLESYRANSNIIQGWIWFSSLDTSVCPTCAALHGSTHTLDETLDGHWNCRCAQIPWLGGVPNPVQTSGEDWFNGLSESEQREIMGKGMYEGWRDGKFKLADVVTQSPDEIFGEMRTTKPLKDLIDE